MAKLKKISERRYRIICDCGKYQHDIYTDDEGKPELESYLIPGKENDGTPKENTTNTPKPKHKRGIFEPIGEDEE